MDFGLIGKSFLLFGLVIAVIGAVLLLLPKIPFAGRLPGDIMYSSGNVRIYAPIMTCILLSLLLTILMNLFGWRR